MCESLNFIDNIIYGGFNMEGDRRNDKYGIVS